MMEVSSVLRFWDDGAPLHLRGSHRYEERRLQQAPAPRPTSAPNNNAANLNGIPLALIVCLAIVGVLIVIAIVLSLCNKRGCCRCKGCPQDHLPPEQPTDIIREPLASAEATLAMPGYNPYAAAPMPAYLLDDPDAPPPPSLPPASSDPPHYSSQVHRDTRTHPIAPPLSRTSRGPRHLSSFKNPNSIPPLP
jgi:hypothetical protein